jgi:uncharacterized protein
MRTQSSLASGLPAVAPGFQKKNDRVAVLDVIKAFALFGIFVLHVIGPFSGWVEYLLPNQKQLLPTAEFDVWINKAVHILLAEKCRGAFSFLFGIAFYFQLQKAERQGVGFNFLFLKRLALLFICGIFHAYLLFAGDVLRYYAVCGLFLLLVYKWPPRRILILGTIFLTVLPVAFIVLTRYFPYGHLDFQKWQEVRNGFMGNSYLDLIKVNFFLDWRSQLHVHYKLQFLSVVLGQFLLGLWAGKERVFARVPHFRHKFLRLFWLGLTVGLLSFCFTYYLDRIDLFKEFRQLTGIAHDIFYLIGNQALILCYVCGLTLIFQMQKCQKILLVLAPTGRMSLSNYLLQSIIGALIFYGVGLGYFGRFGPTFSIPLTVVLFSGQVLFSRYWLRQFELGPVEMIFRSVLNWNGQLKSQEPAIKTAS